MGNADASGFGPCSHASGVPSIRCLTDPGPDHSPSVSADGKRVCFSSDRDGTDRIWVKEIGSGWETPLTSGPDDFPRLSRDGSAVRFTRLGAKRALFRVPSNYAARHSQIVAPPGAGVDLSRAAIFRTVSRLYIKGVGSPAPGRARAGRRCSGFWPSRGPPRA
jgi:dipeptidyl aminopeptidase/acylaminoacyl peptidase